jgi:hypothetical protein
MKFKQRFHEARIIRIALPYTLDLRPVHGIISIP